MLKKIISFILIFTLIYTIITEDIAYADNFDLKSKSAILMDASTGKVLYEKNSHEELPPASVTKVMTMLLVMEALDSGKIKTTDKVVTSEHAFDMGGTQIYLEVGEEMTVDDLLKSVAMNSANDASVALAEYISGSEEKFVEEMNKRAKELGAKNTNFKNASGLPEKDHYTSVYDIALISRELVKHKGIFKYLTDKIDSVRNGKFSLANTNKLLWRYQGADGIKTGSTSEALYCLSATAKRGDTRFIAVIFGAPDSNTRFKEASKLLDYGFANFETKKVVEAGKIYGTVKVLKGEQDYINAVANTDEYVLLKKGEAKNIKQEIIINKYVEAPIKVGAKIGTIKIYDGNNLIKTVSLTSNQNVKKSNIFDNLRKVYKSWIEKN
ncbi:Serine-type D-Ala-D-Ala carboxypeptidase [Thermoanaerobacterium thermosaccharolyticum DSM 571]|jgi:serine-type D-Ala-D-Ala carboxypeptidase (penicillin-binding protein 5/6)|uniref:serine-type D-Ala-D-Ala carboxypeptidase n=1 Tax=Thermoanaerobacterium thermosaccharolyticum (strain ATCC 7956 / DSM 571 / NCIMB 9385 / NCA 3814 / NCTC 13789 / WDCM 00135 / 2032) TaxID=580327 RepID=D9TQV2_THETC|nr:D-alanyl-D-alanine carboxypeptidase family protein [Thermoanaerobacterium thermosaccharolyticum]ADL68845.1 Serine-type D-Ala-D-Ala carboxypeptidase [Thermoanaerobacterium thermosaccharolyticum DSM 571]